MTVFVTFSAQERHALVRMLEHEHFSYTDEGQVALAAFKKIRDAVTAEQEARLLDVAADAYVDAKALLRDLEWSGHIWDVVRADLIDGVCPSCRKPSTKTFQQMWTDQAKRFGPAGHAVDCKLRALVV